MKARRILGKVLATVAALAVVAGIAAFIYRNKIVQYSADAAIRAVLPEYVEVDRIVFDLAQKRLTLVGFRITNPPEFQNAYLLEVGEIVTEYRMKGRDILDGVEILEPVFHKAVLTVERLGDGSINLQKMPGYIKSSASAAARPVAPATPAVTPGPVARQEAAIDERVRSVLGERRISDIVAVPGTFSVTKGRLVFIDRLGSPRAHVLSIDDIDARMTVALDKEYAAVLRAGSEGHGVFNEERDQVVRWKSSYDPTTPRLTMSNRFDITGIDIMALKPYYDRFSPIDFRRGYASGALVFDFDNGNIGSVCEIRLDKVAFLVKPGDDGTTRWDAPAQDLARYFAGPSGEVIFDFKIKGDMDKPKFFLGPISRQAVTAMAVDKVVTKAVGIVQGIVAQSQDAAGSVAGMPGQAVSGDSTQDYVDLISELLKKKK